LIPHWTPPPHLIRYTVFGADAAIASAVVHAHNVFVCIAIKYAPFDDCEGADRDGGAVGRTKRSNGRMRKQGLGGRHAGGRLHLAVAAEGESVAGDQS
jgi:hypothetical protein